MINSKLISRIQRRLDDSTGRTYTGNEIVDELQNASAEISSHRTFKKYLFPETSTAITLVSGTDTYALPDDYNYQIHRVVYNPASNSSVQLSYIPLNMVHQLQAATGQVLYYHPRGTNLILADIPAASDNGITLQVLYSENDGTYANDGNETVLGKKFPHLLINKVAYELSASEQDGEISSSADRLGKAYDNAFAVAIQGLSQQGTTESQFVQINPQDTPL